MMWRDALGNGRTRSSMNAGERHAGTFRSGNVKQRKVAMTVAVCIRCGRIKIGAFCRCPGCGLSPTQPEDLAKSVMLSEQVCDRPALVDVSGKLMAGDSVEFDSAAVAEWVEGVRSRPNDLRITVGCVITSYAPLVIMILLCVVLAVALAYPK
jgi:hypothetical protein